MTGPDKDQPKVPVWEEETIKFRHPVHRTLVERKEVKVDEQGNPVQATTPTGAPKSKFQRKMERPERNERTKRVYCRRSDLIKLAADMKFGGADIQAVINKAYPGLFTRTLAGKWEINRNSTHYDEERMQKLTFPIHERFFPKPVLVPFANIIGTEGSGSRWDWPGRSTCYWLAPGRPRASASGRTAASRYRPGKCRDPMPPTKSGRPLWRRCGRMK
jgi:hypothetical protein